MMREESSEDDIRLKTVSSNLKENIDLENNELKERSFQKTDKEEFSKQRPKLKGETKLENTHNIQDLLNGNILYPKAKHRKPTISDKHNDSVINEY
jgi:hypothetical protein